MTKLELITRILDSVPGVRKEGGGAWMLSEHPEVALYIGMPSEVLTVPRVAVVAAGADLTVITTHKGETYLFATDLIAGAKFGAADVKGGTRTSAGFR